MRTLYFSIYLIVFCICAIDPYDRSVWLAENFPMWILVLGVLITSRYHKFSNASYICMLFLPVLHTIGGHFTFERVPFRLVTELFGFERNHFDRIAHFSVGLFAYPICEVAWRNRTIQSRFVLVLFAVSVIFSVASIYEILEWWYAAFSSPEAGSAVLGSQGDIWDAQRDMLADGLGAIFAVLIFALINKERNWRPSVDRADF